MFSSSLWDVTPGRNSEGGRSVLTSRAGLLRLTTNQLMQQDREHNELSVSLDMTLRQWIERYQRDVVFDQVHYRGVPTWKNVLDLWVIQEIIWETQVDAVVEIGVKHGGTTLWLSDILQAFRGANACVIGVDLERPATVLPPNVYFVEGDSVAPATVAKVRSLCDSRRTMIMADGDHRASHVLRELRAYAPLVAIGAYFIAEDGIVDVMQWTEYTPGPLRAARKFVSETNEFVIDRAREKFLLTYAPDGFLKRVLPADNT